MQTLCKTIFPPGVYEYWLSFPNYIDPLYFSTAYSFFKENVCKFFFRVSKRNPRKDCKVVDETIHPAGKESLMCNIPKCSDTLSVFQKMLQDL